MRRFKIHGQEGKAQGSTLPGPGQGAVPRYKEGAKKNVSLFFKSEFIKIRHPNSCRFGKKKEKRRREHTCLLDSSMNRKDIHIITLSQLIKKEININKNGHKIFTNVSTVFKNKRRKGCSGVRRM